MKKLVRDKIIDIIKQRGDFCEYYICDGEELFFFMKKKLIEESNEVFESDNIYALKEELADLFEVFLSILKHKKIELNEIYEIRKNKKMEKGGFERGIILTNNIINKE